MQVDRDHRDINSGEINSRRDATVPGGMLAQHGWLLLVGLLVFFANLGGYALFDEDEPKNAVCGREMFERGDWVVPTFNAELRTDKPILIYWLMQISFGVFGVSEFSARLGSSVMAVGSVMLTFHLGRALYSSSIGLLAGIVLATCLMFSAVGRAVTPDATLLFCLMLAFSGYVWAVAIRRGGHFSGVTTSSESVPSCATSRETAWTELLPATIGASLPMYAAMGLAILAKGPIGVVLPCMIIGLFLLVTKRRNDLESGTLSSPQGAWWRQGFLAVAQVMWPAHIVRVGWGMRLLVGAAVVGLVCLPWYVLVGIRTEGAWLQGFLGDHNVGRFLGPKENHSGPIFYYLIVLLLGCFPWSVFLPMAVWQLKTRLFAKSQGCDTPWCDSDRFLACWTGVWLTFFSLAGTKLPNYVLPMYPALALIVARFLHDWARSFAMSSVEHLIPDWTTSLIWSCRALTIVGVLMMIGVGVASAILLPGEEWLALIGAAPAVGGLLGLRAIRRQEPNLALRHITISAVALATLLVGIAPTRIGLHQDSPHLADAARRAAGTDKVALASTGYFSPSLVFYARHPIHKLGNPTDVARFLHDHPQGYVIARADKLEPLQAAVPHTIEVARHRRFLRRYDLVLLGKAPETATRDKTNARR